MDGKLYLVATPIGNLEDITLRAIKILKEVDYIAAEDTRHTLKLLNHLGISKPLISYYKEIEREKSELILLKLKEGKNIALVSDAGTPGISDPGEIMVRKAIENQIEIIPIPGACACISALIASGLSTREFSFIGFLPTNQKEKTEKLEELKEETRTLIFYEAPHKLKNTIEKMEQILGNRDCTLARELTKIHEEFIRGTLATVLLKEEEPKGEFVILVKGAEKTKKEIENEKISEKTLEEQYYYYQQQGFEKKEIIKLIAKNQKVSKNEIYQYFLKIKI